jgi:hypothetical protein
MNKLLGAGLLLLLPVVLLSSCVAVREAKTWSFHQLKSSKSPRPYIGITMEHPALYLPFPLVAWQFRLSKAYYLTLDVHTPDEVYDRLDSVGYRFWAHPNQILASGTLPVRYGTFSRRAYSPDVHRAQCETPARIVLPNTAPELKGRILLYLTDTARHRQVIHLDSVSLRYHKARFGSIL